jgi:hypothetical protein
LRENLGPCLGGLTGQDWPALKCAVHIANLWLSTDHDGKRNAAQAFRSVVFCMQPNLRWLAYHSIAHVGSWSHRNDLWREAGLPVLEHVPRCKFES